MARYIAKERGQIPVDGAIPVKRIDSSPSRRVMRIVEAGEEFEFHGKPGKWMQRIDGSEPQDGQTGNGRPGRPRATRAQDGQTGQDGSQGKKPQNGENPQEPASP